VTIEPNVSPSASSGEPVEASFVFKQILHVKAHFDKLTVTIELKFQPFDKLRRAYQSLFVTSKAHFYNLRLKMNIITNTLPMSD